MSARLESPSNRLDPWLRTLFDDPTSVRQRAFEIALCAVVAVSLGLAADGPTTTCGVLGAVLLLASDNALGHRDLLRLIAGGLGLVMLVDRLVA